MLIGPVGSATEVIEGCVLLLSFAKSRQHPTELGDPIK